jgi:hypothetical protein
MEKPGICLYRGGWGSEKAACVGEGFQGKVWGWVFLASQLR